MRFGIAELRLFIERHRRMALLGAGLLVLAGIDLVLFPPKGVVLEWLALPFLGAGLALLAVAAKRSAPEPDDGPPTLATRLIRRLTLNGRLVRWLPTFGIAIVLADLAYNAFLSVSPELGTEDTFTLLFGAALIAYPYVPATYRRERDFVFTALLFLLVVFVVPLLIARAFSGNWEYSVDLYSWAALAYQVAAVVGAFGVPATVHAVPGSTAPGLTVPTNAGIEITLVITTACSGLYSFGLFTAAFFAYVLTEFRRLSWRVWAFLSIGILASYFANILRMVVIVLSGVYANSPEESVQNLLVAHSYAGWLIFLAWIAAFWVLLVRFLRPVPGSDGVSAGRSTDLSAAGTPPIRRGVHCHLCDEVLTPGRPGSRCDCGTFYHALCATTEAECPRCLRPMPGVASAAPADA